MNKKQVITIVALVVLALVMMLIPAVLRSHAVASWKLNDLEKTHPKLFYYEVWILLGVCCYLIRVTKLWDDIMAQISVQENVRNINVVLDFVLCIALAPLLSSIFMIAFVISILM